MSVLSKVQQNAIIKTCVVTWNYISLRVTNTHIPVNAAESWYWCQTVSYFVRNLQQFYMLYSHNVSLFVRCNRKHSSFPIFELFITCTRASVGSYFSGISYFTQKLIYFPTPKSHKVKELNSWHKGHSDNNLDKFIPMSKCVGFGINITATSYSYN